MAIECSSDGGTTWNVVANVPKGGNLEGISYGSPTVAYTVGDSGIFKTVNAGVADVTTITWTKLTDPPPNPGHTAATFGDVHCTDATHCWLAGDQATTGNVSVGSAAIAVTTNGTAFSMQPACAAYGLEAVALPPGDPLHGWAGGSTVTNPLPGVPGSMCVTSNG
ncbi:MAG TPA: hypothetical protein VGR61_03030, partial [Candidatus Dormibacteraeota bacterium]|nr:hypothetical protein [Candidatus Dormibacteraeota bacterium]